MKRDFFERRIKRQQEEVAELDKRISNLTAQRLACLAVIGELEAILRQIPKTPTNGAQKELRHGTLVYRAREALRKAAQPLHIKILLQQMGVPAPTREQKRSLSAQLLTYAKNGEFFTNPDRATFGLLDYTIPEPSDEEKEMMLREQHDQFEQDSNPFVAGIGHDDIPF